MKVVSVLYHDVVESGREDDSGFPGSSAALYKLPVTEIREHLDAIASVALRPPILIDSLLADNPPPWPRLLLTFDDGGVSALTHTAGVLEDKGWRGHFFVTTDFIGRPTFLSADQIRQLQARGHVIGSHSCSHPERMAACSAEELAHEWSDSIRTLSDILGEPVICASVPNGYFNRAVAVAAAKAGIKALFTSEPVRKAWHMAGTLVLGRYTLKRGTQGRLSADLVAGAIGPRCREYFSWNLKKAVKAVGGKYYLALRERMLREG